MGRLLLVGLDSYGPLLHCAGCFEAIESTNDGHGLFIVECSHCGLDYAVDTEYEGYEGMSVNFSEIGDGSMRLVLMRYSGKLVVWENKTA